MDDLSHLLVPLEEAKKVAEAQAKTAENLAAALNIKASELTDDEKIFLPPRARQDNTLQRARRIKLILKLMVEGISREELAEKVSVEIAKIKVS